MIDHKKHILLFENCILTKGHTRSLLIDTQRKDMEFIDNEIVDIFNTKSRVYSIEKILSSYDDEKGTIILEYFEYFIEKEFAFLCDKNEVEHFPVLDKKWDYPAKISNSIIDFNNSPKDITPYLKFITELSTIGCEDLQIRDYKGLSMDILNQLLNHCRSVDLYRISLVIKFSNPIKIYKDLLKKHPIIHELVIHSYNKDIQFTTNTHQNFYGISTIIKDQGCCGVVAPKHFNFDLRHILESLNANTCLNRKICIDVNGNIKNCPSMQISYGNVNDGNIHDVLKNKAFKKVGGIKKDTIEDCKVCEFRHVCTDCRAYHKKDYSLKKPSKCNYNPYKAVWD